MTDPEPAEAVTEDAQDRASDDPATPEDGEQASVPAAPDCADDHPNEHVEDLPDGAGCTEIWEHLSERRAEDD